MSIPSHHADPAFLYHRTIPCSPPLINPAPPPEPTIVPGTLCLQQTLHTSAGSDIIDTDVRAARSHIRIVLSADLPEYPYEHVGLYSRCERGHTLKQQVGRQAIWPRSGPSLDVPPDVLPRFHLLCWTTSRREGRAFCRQSLKGATREEGKGRSWRTHCHICGGRSHLPISAPAQRPCTHCMTGKCRCKGLLLRVEYINRPTLR